MKDTLENGLKNVDFCSFQYYLSVVLDFLTLQEYKKTWYIHNRKKLNLLALACETNQKSSPQAYINKSYISAIMRIQLYLLFLIILWWNLPVISAF
jgi:hypothetical protein